MTSVAQRGLTYHRRHPDQTWYALGHEPLTPVLDRSTLVAGAYRPSELTTGLLTGWTPAMLTPVYAPGSSATVAGSSTAITITTPGPHENKIFWGTVHMKSPTEPAFRNCWFAGPDPRLITSATGTTKAFGTGYYQWRAEDSVFDSSAWMDPSLTRPGAGAALDFATWNRAVARGVNGIHGGRFTVLRSQIAKVADGWQQTQIKADSSDPAYSRLEACWMHGNVYYWAADWADVPVQSDGNHADAIQLAMGSNLTILGNRIGGVRDTTGFTTYDPSTNPTGVSYNSGDDAWNSGLIFTQQGSADDLHLLQNIVIEKNFFEGGKYCINHGLQSIPNDFSTTYIRDNYFVRRPDGKYVIRHASYAGSYSNNREITVDEAGGYTVGSLITYTNG